jgi:hypothetical protein
LSSEHVKRLDLHCPIAAELDHRISNPFILVPSERTVTALLNDVSPHVSSLTRIIGDRVPISTDKPEVGLLLLPFDIQSLDEKPLEEELPMLAHQSDEMTALILIFDVLINRLQLQIFQVSPTLREVGEQLEIRKTEQFPTGTDEYRQLTR